MRKKRYNAALLGDKICISVPILKLLLSKDKKRDHGALFYGTAPAKAFLS